MMRFRKLQWGALAVVAAAVAATPAVTHAVRGNPSPAASAAAISGTSGTSVAGGSAEVQRLKTATKTVVPGVIPLPPRLTGVNIRSGRVAASAVAIKVAVADCLPGQRVIGGGAAVSGSNGQVMVTSMVPGFSAYVVRAIAQPHYLQSWSLDAFAVCANPPPGIQLVSRASEPSGPLGNADASVACPAGKVILGAGGAILGGGSNVSLTRLQPSRGGGYAFVRADIRAGYFDETAPIRSVAHAVCANRPLGWGIVWTESARRASPLNTATVTCPAGKVALGAGMSKRFDGHGQHFLIGALPLIGTTTSSVTVSAQSGYSYPNEWTISAWAACATR